MSATNEERIQELERKVAEQPGAPEFVELAKLLGDDPSNRARAREVCFQGLNESPKNHLGRLQLARLFYLDNLGEFAVRELIELSKYTTAPSIGKLLDSFGPFAKPFLESMEKKKTAPVNEAHAGAAPQTEEAVIAEFDLDAEFTDALEELETKKT